MILLVTSLDVADETITLQRAAEVIARVDARRVVFGVRDHQAEVRRRVELARALVAKVRGSGARVVVHDRVDVAKLVAADGAWLGERSIAIDDARALLGDGALVGRSCHDADGLARAARDGADAATLSPLFASPGKGPALGTARFAELRKSVPRLRVLALGGVDDTNARDASNAGADGVAAIRAWLAPDGAERVRAMLAPFAR